MADKELELDPTETPVIFGLWKLIPSGEPEKPPTENYIIKNLSLLFEMISLPIIRLLYASNQIPLEYTRTNHMGIVLVILILPLTLFLSSYYKKIPKLPTKPFGSAPTKPFGSKTAAKTATEKRKWDEYYKYVKIWNKYYANLKAYYSEIQSRNISYMICLWMSMFVLIIFLYPRLKNTTE